uniref:UBX domain-containing protein n=1 Tax=Panagrolaimus davidi TaxID=227884 RepID=A0A914QM72_9BILA
MTSEITNSEIIAQTGLQNRVAELRDTDTGNWDLMILSEKKFITIEKDEVNIRRCAYIYAKYVLPEIMESKKKVHLNLKESFAAELEFFKGIFKKHVGEVSSEVKEKELIEGWINAEEARQKHLGKLEDQITGPKELKVGNIVNANGASTSSKLYSNEFAVNDLHVYCTGHSLLDGIKVSFTNHKIELFKILKEKCGNGTALALMVCIERSCGKNESAKKFLNLIRKIAKNEGNNHLELKIRNENVQKILALHYARNALELFGYREVMVENEAMLVANSEIIEQECKEAEKCLKFIESINDKNEFVCHYDHTFKLVENGIPLQECRLPSIFFDKKKEQNSSIALPIRILKEKRRLYSFADFSLIRVKLQDGRLFQAVFHKNATLNDIGAELDLLFLNELNLDPVYCVCDENGKEIKDMSQSLDKFGFYPAIMMTLI